MHDAPEAGSLMQLQPGQRLKLITNIASVLAAKPWAEMDLHLRQFGLPWSEMWQGDSRTYVLSHLERGDDDGLTGLHDFLFPRTRDAEVAGEGHWEPGRFRLFMSHISVNKALVSETKTELARYGVDGFVAHEDIEPAKEWVTEIETALATCHAMAAFLTPDFHSSRWTDQELGYCLRRGVLIVPIRLGCDPYGFIGKYQGPQGLGKTPVDLASALFKIFVEHESTAREMASAVVNYFADSFSYNETRRRWPLLEAITAWTPELLQRIETAARENSQIRDCTYMPDRIQALVARHSGPG